MLKLTMMVAVLAFSGCAVDGGDPVGGDVAPPPADVPPAAAPAPHGTCGQLLRRATVPRGADGLTPIHCGAIDLDPALTLQVWQDRDDVELLACPRDGAPDAYGVYGFRGAADAWPELHPDEPCEWIAIDPATCAAR